MYVRMYVCLYVRMYVCMYVCMYAFMYVYTQSKHAAGGNAKGQITPAMMRSYLALRKSRGMGRLPPGMPSMIQQVIQPATDNDNEKGKDNSNGKNVFLFAV